MFTGIVSDIGAVAAVADHHGQLRRLSIHCAYDPDGIAIGASIACSGPCLTVVAKGPLASGPVAGGTGRGGAWFEVDVGAETLARTSVGGWTVGTRVNLERSLKFGDELGGHMVSGHVDGLAEVIERHAVTGEETAAEAAEGAGEWGPTARFVLRAPRRLARFIAEKGSVALDGTSLTVNSVDGDVFSVLLIPHTLAVTTWGERQAGDRLNLEVDLIARYAARLAEARAAGY